MMQLADISNKRIAYTCFDWGFGHVTRSIEIIQQLIAQNNEVVFFGSSNQYDFLVSYNPTLKFESWELPKLHFSKSGAFVWDGIRNALNVLRTWKIESTKLQSAHEKLAFDVVISDHRYGFRLMKVTSIFVTHQLHLPQEIPFWIQRIHKKKINQFSEIWLLDDANSTCAGDLSRGGEVYLGIKSRFPFSTTEIEKTDVPLLVLSGPEVFAKDLLEKVRKSAMNQPINIIAPKQMETGLESENWFVLGKLSYKELDDLFLSSSVVISRSGYSTIMDLTRTRKQGILLATKGQYEQVYLANLHKTGNIHCFVDEKAFENELNRLFQRNPAGSNNG